jgi:hypothetical protein
MRWMKIAKFGHLINWILELHNADVNAHIVRILTPMNTRSQLYPYEHVQKIEATNPWDWQSYHTGTSLSTSTSPTTKRTTHKAHEVTTCTSLSTSTSPSTERTTHATLPPMSTFERLSQQTLEIDEVATDALLRTATSPTTEKSPVKF